MSDSRENGSGVVALTIPARAEYVALCRLALTGLARARELEPEVVADLKLALTEACSNSVRHAYEEGRDGLVQISYELDGDRIAVEVADDGAGFDP
jgi:serine/threonine-protein kinase RsbW